MPTRQQAEARYRELRAMSRAKAIEIAALPVPVQIRDIDHSALDAFSRSWVDIPDRLVNWQWDQIVADFRSRPRRFEAAIWSNDELCGLAIGICSDSHQLVSIRFIEGSPAPAHPLKGFVLRLVLEAAHAFGVAVGAAIMRLEDPFLALVPVYQKMGFSLVNPRPGVTYCDKEIG